MNGEVPDLAGGCGVPWFILIPDRAGNSARSIYSGFEAHSSQAHLRTTYCRAPTSFLWVVIFILLGHVVAISSGIAVRILHHGTSRDLPLSFTLK